MLNVFKEQKNKNYKRRTKLITQTKIINGQQSYHPRLINSDKNIDIMNKEEQKQNLFKTLLQRNQLNLQAIRKYRKKTNTYYKRVTRQADTPTSDVLCVLSTNAQILQDNQPFKQFKQVQEVPQNCQDIQKILMNSQCVRTDPVIHTARSANQKQKDNNQSGNSEQIEQTQTQSNGYENQANHFRLPSIVNSINSKVNCNIAQTKSEASVNDYITKAEKELCESRAKFNNGNSNTNNINIARQFRNQFAISLCEKYSKNKKRVATDIDQKQVIGKNQKQKQQLQDNSQNNEEYLKNNSSLKKQIQKAANLNEVLKHANMTHNIRSIIPQSNNSKLVNKLVNEYPNHKREGRLSNSHKALLNLHSIVFENSSANKPKTKFKQGSQVLTSVLQKQERYSTCGKTQINHQNVFIHPKSKQKYKCKGKQDKQKQNIGLIYQNKNGFNLFGGGSFSHINSYDSNQKSTKKNGQLTDLQILNNAIVAANHNSSLSSISSGAISTLSYLNSNFIPNKANQKQNSVKTQQNYESMGSKQSQFLPQIKKLKQFRVNFNKLVRKEQQTAISNNKNSIIGLNPIVGQLAFRNNTASILHQNQGHNASYSLNTITNNTQPMVEQNEMSRRAFRIQAIPVHQIKWM